MSAASPLPSSSCTAPSRAWRVRHGHAQPGHRAAERVNGSTQRCRPRPPRRSCPTRPTTTKWRLNASPPTTQLRRDPELHDAPAAASAHRLGFEHHRNDRDSQRSAEPQRPYHPGAFRLGHKPDQPEPLQQRRAPDGRDAQAVQSRSPGYRPTTGSTSRSVPTAKLPVNEPAVLGSVRRSTPRAR